MAKAKGILDKCQKIPVITIGNKKLHLYFPPNELRAQYNNTSLEWLFNKYKETQNQEFIKHFYMYKIAVIFFGDGLTSNLKRGRRFKESEFNEQLKNIYKSNAPNPLPSIQFKTSDFNILAEDKLLNPLEETFRKLIKIKLKNDRLYFDNTSYIDFKVGFLNGLIRLTWNKRNITKDEVRHWGEKELSKVDIDIKTLLRLDCERYYLGLNDIANHKIYKLIRKHLPQEEKRLFMLCWFMHYKALSKKSPYLPFGYRIPSFYRIFLDFYLGMSNPVKQDLLNFILFKKTKIELNDLWNKYLKVYPLWLLIIKDEDRITKQMVREPLNSLNKVIAKDKNGKEQTLGDTIGQENFALLLNLTKTDILNNPALTNKEKEIVRLLLDGYSISNIAQGKKVSQPAISKMLKNIREKLKNNST